MLVMVFNKLTLGNFPQKLKNTSLPELDIFQTIIPHYQECRLLLNQRNMAYKVRLNRSWEKYQRFFWKGVVVGRRGGGGIS